MDILNHGKSHDAFFASMMTDLDVVKDFLSSYVDKKLLAYINLNEIEICKDKQILPELKHKSTDMVYRVKLVPDQEMFIALHVEHQSKEEKNMPLRCLQYHATIMENHLKIYGDIPLVYTIVYYNGQKPWRSSSDLRDLIRAPKALIEEFALKPFKLVDLNKIEDKKLREQKLAGIMSMLMKHIHQRDLYHVLMSLVEEIKQFVASAHSNHIDHMVYYVMKTGRYLQKQDVADFVDQVMSKEDGERLMTVAEQYFQDGKQEGILQGMQQGQQRGIQEGKQQGMEAACRTVARNMLAKGMAIDLVSELTGLSVSQVEALEFFVE
ncbi:MAG: Rpn family recombination-promoting nuclease/putative transposase [Gammaproteobacteria bacterium]